MDMKRTLLYIVFFTLALTRSWPERFIGDSGLPLSENTESRIAMKEIIYAPANSAMAAPQRIFEGQSENGRVLFRTEKQGDAFYLLFLNEADYRFPVYGAGSYIVKRKQSDGSFVQVKIFYKTDPDCYIRIFPFAERSRMDVYLYGYPVYKNVNLPFAFKAVLTMPFRNLFDVTAKSVRWDLLFPERNDSFDIAERFSYALNRSLSSLRDGEDGALDASGDYVYIESGMPMEEPGFNCSGFAKWVVDSLYYPLKKKYIDISLLKEKHLALRGNRWSNRHEEDRDPYFGLDWNRNLSIILDETRNGTAPEDPEAFDVRDLPFFGYIEDVGYQMADIKPVLYLATIKTPGSIFLGSVNSWYGSEPSLQQHFHVAVFVPYITEDGGFSLDVYERSAASSVDALKERYPHDFIHLVEVPLTNAFRFPGAMQLDSVNR